MAADYTLLLTGTIDVSKTLGGKNRDLAVRSLDERLNQYETAITRYIQESAFTHIVFVETSNFDFNFKKYVDLADKYHKKFEYITFLGNYEKVMQKGKSYGDAEAIIYALENSKLIEQTETIYKITGRVFLRNSHAIVKGSHRAKNEFISFSKGDRCVTYCFKVNKSDFIDNFSNLLDLCDEVTNNDLETVFYKILQESNMDVKPFVRYPKITGVIGGLGIKYDKKWYQYMAADVLMKFGKFSVPTK